MNDVDHLPMPHAPSTPWRGDLPLLAVLPAVLASVVAYSGCSWAMSGLVLVAAAMHALAWRVKSRQFLVLSCLLSVLLCIWAFTGIVDWGSLTSGTLTIVISSAVASLATALLALVPAGLLHRTSFGVSVDASFPLLKHMLLVSGMLALLAGSAVGGAYLGGSRWSVFNEPALAVSFAGVALLLLLIAGSALRLRELQLLCIFLSPFILLQPMGYFTQFSPLIPILVATAVFTANSFVVRDSNWLPTWFPLFNGTGFILLLLFTALVLPADLAVTYPYGYPLGDYLAFESFWLFLIIAAFFVLGYLTRNLHVCATACLLSVYGGYTAIMTLHTPGWEFIVAKYQVQIEHALALVLVFLTTWFLKKKLTAQGQSPGVRISVAIHLAVAAGCVLLLHGVCYVADNGIANLTSGSHYDPEDALAPLSWVTAGLALFSVTGVLTRFREMLVTSVFLTPVLASIVVAIGMGGVDRTEISVSVLVYAGMFTLHMFLLGRRKDRSGHDRLMLLDTEITLCGFAFFATIALVVSLSRKEQFAESGGYLTSPYIVAIWALLSLLALRVSRNSDRVVFRVAPLIAFGAVLMVVMMAVPEYYSHGHTPFFSVRTFYLLLALASGILAGLTLVRDRHSTAFILWGHILWGLSALSVVFILWQNLAK